MARNAFQHISTGPPVDLPGYSPIASYQGAMSWTFRFREDVLSAGLAASGAQGYWWLRPNSGAGTNIQVCFQRDSGDNVQVGVYDATGATIYGETAGNFFDITTLTASNWYNLLLTHDGTTGTSFNAYLYNDDGTVFASSTGLTSVALPTTPAAPQIFFFRGSTTFSPTPTQAEGLFDSATLWTKVITKDEALGFPEGSESNLIYAFAFNEGTGGTSVANYVTANDDLDLTGMVEGTDFDWADAAAGAIHPDPIQHNVRLYDDDALPSSATALSSENDSGTTAIAAADITQFLANFSRVDDVGSIGAYFSTDGGSTWTAVGSGTTIQYADSPNIPAGSNTASAVLTAVGALSLDTANSDWRDDQSTASLTGVSDSDYIELGRAIQYATGTGGGNDAIITFRRSADLPLTYLNRLTIQVTADATGSVKFSNAMGGYLKVNSGREGNLRLYFDAFPTFSGEKGGEGAALSRFRSSVRVVGGATAQSASGSALAVAAMQRVAVSGEKGAEGIVTFASSPYLYTATVQLASGQWVAVTFKVPKNWIQIDPTE